MKATIFGRRRQIIAKQNRHTYRIEAGGLQPIVLFYLNLKKTQKKHCRSNVFRWQHGTLSNIIKVVKFVKRLDLWQT